MTLHSTPSGMQQARPRLLWQLRTRTLALGLRTLVMGIVNITPDSFSNDGLEAPAADRRHTTERAVAYGLRLLAEGAAILDLGGESTRPGSGAAGPNAIATSEEQDRVLPVVEGLLRERPDVLLSIDTYRAATAAAALAAGVQIVNDVSGLLWDEAMAEVCGQARCGVVLMHTRGRPESWKTQPALAAEAVVPLVLVGLRERLQAAEAAGIGAERIVLDPGYGFGKAFDANYALLRDQARLLALGRPLLAGVSRKSFLGRTLGQIATPTASTGVDVPASARDTASVAASVAAVLHGASLLRVHAVRPAVEAAAIADAVLRGGGLL